MDNQITLDGHVFTLRDNGLYEVDEPYVIDKSWMFEKEHFDKIMIFNIVEGIRYAWLLSDDKEDRHSAYENFMKLNSENKSIGAYIAYDMSDIPLGGIFL